MRLFVGAKGIIEYDGKILLLRESSKYVDGTEVGKWDVPGGRIDPEETLRDGLIREVKEESGLDIEPGTLLGAFDGFPNIKGEECHVIRLYYHCIAKTNEVVLSNDHDMHEWVTPGAYDDKKLVSDIAEMIQVATEKTA